LITIYNYLPRIKFSKISLHQICILINSLLRITSTYDIIMKFTNFIVEKFYFFDKYRLVLLNYKCILISYKNHKIEYAYTCLIKQVHTSLFQLFISYNTIIIVT